MAIVLKCENGHTLRVRDDAAGKKVRCPECQTVVVIDEDAAADDFEARQPTSQSSKRQGTTGAARKKGKNKKKTGSGTMVFVIAGAAGVVLLLVGLGLATALLAGLVMLTRVSIKVRLAWSTAAQMGFMVMECGLGLYTLALLHLIGHSLYKAHAFLAASGAVEQARLRAMRAPAAPSVAGLLAAPLVAAALVGAVVAAVPAAPWPAWWSGVLALAWAPLLWWPAASQPDAPGALRRLLGGAVMVALLAAAALVGHALPFGVNDAPDAAAGVVALAGMVLLYAALALLQARPHALAGWRRWSYAGFYVDEIATRAALRLWPARWTPAAAD